MSFEVYFYVVDTTACAKACAKADTTAEANVLLYSFDLWFYGLSLRLVASVFVAKVEQCALFTRCQYEVVSP